MAMSCPNCGEGMVDRIVHSSGIVVCEEQYLTAMRELQAEEDAGRGPAHRHLGHTEHVLPMWPSEQKYARAKYCSNCKLIVVAQSDQIPPEEIPAIAK
jgi:hypothetical protein